MAGDKVVRLDLPQLRLLIEAGLRRVGAADGKYVLIRKIIADYGLDEMMKRIIGKVSSLFLDLAAYSIIPENNAGQYYPDYGYNHPLFTDKMRIYSDSRVSDFITGITPDQSAGLLNSARPICDSWIIMVMIS